MRSSSRRGAAAARLGDFEAIVLSDAAQTGAALSVLQTQDEPAGFGPPLHVAPGMPLKRSALVGAIADSHDMQLIGPLPDTYLRRQ